jgi:hypothetical protein
MRTIPPFPASPAIQTLGMRTIPPFPASPVIRTWKLSEASSHQTRVQEQTATAHDTMLLQTSQESADARVQAISAVAVVTAHRWWQLKRHTAVPNETAHHRRQLKRHSGGDNRNGTPLVAIETAHHKHKHKAIAVPDRSERLCPAREPQALQANNGRMAKAQHVAKVIHETSSPPQPCKSKAYCTFSNMPSPAGTLPTPPPSGAAQAPSLTQIWACGAGHGRAAQRVK